MRNQADSRRIFLTAEWRDVVLLSYAAERRALRRFLPSGLEFDDWRGQTLISIVGFQFARTRLLGCPVPFHGNFPEVNLRFYVRRQGPEGMRRGVVFLREMVPMPAVALIARRLYHENYARLPMTQIIEPGRSAKYAWTIAGRKNWISARTIAAPSLPSHDSIERFILDHHWGYTRTSSGGCLEYRVDRPEWRAYPVDSFEISAEDLGVDAGIAAAFRAEPVSVIYSEGSPVSVSFGGRIA